jgi:hypothetical protein
MSSSDSRMISKTGSGKILKNMWTRKTEATLAVKEQFMYTHFWSLSIRERHDSFFSNISLDPTSWTTWGHMRYIETHVIMLRSRLMHHSSSTIKKPFKYINDKRDLCLVIKQSATVCIQEQTNLLTKLNTFCNVRLIVHTPIYIIFPGCSMNSPIVKLPRSLREFLVEKLYNSFFM